MRVAYTMALYSLSSGWNWMYFRSSFENLSIRSSTYFWNLFMSFFDCCLAFSSCSFCSAKLTFNYTTVKYTIHILLIVSLLINCFCFSSTLGGPSIVFNIEPRRSISDLIADYPSFSVLDTYVDRLVDHPTNALTKTLQQISIHEKN